MESCPSLAPCPGNPIKVVSPQGGEIHRQALDPKEHKDHPRKGKEKSEGSVFCIGEKAPSH